MRALLLLALGPLLLSACSSKGITQVRAQVRGWSGGAGQIRVLARDQTVLASTSLDSAGRFTLPLPSAQALSPFLRPSLLADTPPNCTSSVTSSDPAAQFYQINQLSAFPASGTVPLPLVSQTRSDNPGGAQRLDQRTLIYASTATRVQGERRCPVTPASGAAAQATTSFALNLKAGWNYAVSHQGQDAGGTGTARLESVGDDGFEGWAAL
ncbi:hypothetical protein [Deinococcus rubellus]|uniref:Carboxypeptidase regulatory-like domain-containing protein n=1 Tax=Deinococcus rubellus TaxID=1889240 RepID=A0ABY5YIF5_9DEIO|nr:hypothetical protein [Deinococcus rubellus]UWX64600.1 hypothetical protein N0D28_02755 [Deinococcus rubellus]